MTWSVIVEEIFRIVLIPLICLAVKYFVEFVNNQIANLKAKRENELYHKYLDMLNETIVNAVIATNQTYVNSLKEQGKFDMAAQKIALEKTKDTIFSILSAEAHNYLTNIVGDLDTYVVTAIERQVSDNKLPSVNG